MCASACTATSAEPHVCCTRSAPCGTNRYAGNDDRWLTTSPPRSSTIGSASICPGGWKRWRVRAVGNTGSMNTGMNIASMLPWGSPARSDTIGSPSFSGFSMALSK